MDGNPRCHGPSIFSIFSGRFVSSSQSRSGVRSIKNLNEERVRDFVDKIIVSRSTDRQLDQCNLTLRDLDTLKEVLVSRVLTSLHTRIAYPDKSHTASRNMTEGGERDAANVIPMPGG